MQISRFYYFNPLRNLHTICFACKSMAGFVLGLCLTACGGGGSSSTAAESSNSNSDSISSPLLMTPGAYLASLNSKEWVSIVLRTQQSAGAVNSFLSLYYNSADPDIVSGSGLIAGSTSAILSNVKYFQNTSASIRMGNGTVSKLGDNAIKADLNFPTIGAELAKSFSVAAGMPNNYKYNQAPSLSAVQGNWDGRWSYGIGSADNFTLSVSGQGALSSSLNFQQDCRITQSTLLPNFDGTNLFAWNLTIPNATQCSLKNQVLTGAAFITASPVAGKTQRLYAVAISPDGRGVSFKADR